MSWKPVRALVALLCVGLVAGMSTAAGAVQLPPGQVVINPEGGIEVDGSDGLRLGFNKDSGPIIENGYGASPGSDAVAHRNTTQYCCSGSAPMLNIGGTLYGTGGPAYSSDNADRMIFEVVSLNGSAFHEPVVVEDPGARLVDEPDPGLGSGGAVMRYTITHNELVYVMTRTVTYRFPSASYLDEYSIEIPEGNTDTVKFYLGGDTAPGTSDSGTGVEVTQPVRTIYSVNPNSGIQLGFGEVIGDEPFDGAVVANFYNPTYGEVTAGSDIGFRIDPNLHDAGIMIQWTLGADAGVHTRSLRHFVGARGASATARFTDASIEAGNDSRIDVEILNTGSEEVTGAGYTFAIPAGITASGDVTSSCGGTASVVGQVLTLSDATVASGDNCVVGIPVNAAGAGEFRIGSESMTATVNVENALDSEVLTVTAPPTPIPDPTPTPTPAPSCVRVVTGSFAASTSTSGQVSRLYMATFNRQADAVGHAFWVDALQSGKWSLDQVAGFFVNSPEFQRTYGERTPAEFVDLLYNNVMCRDADGNGRTFWLNGLDNQMTREYIVLFFSQSPEFKRLTSTS